MCMKLVIHFIVFMCMCNLLFICVSLVIFILTNVLLFSECAHVRGNS